MLWAGVLSGCAAALKLSSAAFAAGLLLAAWLAFAGRSRSRARPPVLFTVGCGIGFLAAGGPWFGYLYLEYGSPLFPYFNNLFESEWMPAYEYRDGRFLASSPWEAVRYPFLWAMDPKHVWEQSFFDARPIILYPLMFLLPVVFWRRWRSERPALWFLLVFLAGSYAMWLAVYPIYRYLSVLEMLAPVALFAVFAVLSHTYIAVRRVPALVVSLALVAVAATQSMVSSPRHDARTWDFTIGLETPLSSLPAGSAVVIRYCDEPLAYAALWLPDDVPLIRLCSNLLVPDSESRLLDLAFQRTRRHAGPVFLLHSRRAERPGRDSIPSLPLDVVGLSQETPSRCAPLFDKPELQRLLFDLVLCPLRRL